MTTIAVTGHRPNKLWGYDTTGPHYGQVASALSRAIDGYGADTLITGMALGFDQLAAEVAQSRDDVRCVAAVPFKTQALKWPYRSRRRYNELLYAADEVEVICHGPYAPHKMQVRNEWMVDHADIVVALWDGTPGGTGNCVDYALRKGKPILRVDPRDVTETHCPDFAPANDAARRLSATNGETPDTDKEP